MTRRSSPPIEGPSWVRRGGRIEAPLLLGALPPEVPFGFLGRALPPAEDLVADLELHPIAAAEALALLEASEAVARAELVRGEHGPTGRTAELELEAESAGALASAVAGRRQELYRVGLVLRARSPALGAAERGREGLVRRLAALGFRTRRPVFRARGAVAAPRLDGTDRRPAGYWHTLSTDGAAAFFPFVDEALVEPGGILVGLGLGDSGPVVLDRYAHASHSWGLFGATGAGKTFAAALFALRSLWTVPELELRVLDPLGEFAPLAPAIGGRVVNVGSVEDSGLNPLDPATAGGDRDATAARVGTLLRALFPSLRDEEAAALEAALGRLYAAHSRVPTFADLREELGRGPGGGGRLPTLLDVFRNGPLRNLDRPGAAPPPGVPVVYDLARVPPAHRAFHLAYLLDGLYRELRASDRPKLLIVDEAQLLAATPGTAEFLDGLVRHVRHFRAGLLLVSQSPSDFLAHEAGRSMLRNLRATLLLRQGGVAEDMRRFFQLTDSEAEWLPRAALPREAGYSEALLRFGALHLPIAIVATSPELLLLQERLGRRAASDGLPVEQHV